MHFQKGFPTIEKTTLVHAWFKFSNFVCLVDVTMTTNDDSIIVADLSQFSEMIALSKNWGNSSHDNDIYDMAHYFHDCGLPTHTSNIQIETEKHCSDKIHRWLLRSDIEANAYLERRRIINHLLQGLKSLPCLYEKLDSTRTWIVYWILNSLYLLNADCYINNKLQKNIINFIKSCQNNQTGGFGGGPKQYSHIATSFGAVMTLMTIGTKEAYDVIDRYVISI